MKTAAALLLIALSFAGCAPRRYEQNLYFDAAVGSIVNASAPPRRHP